MTSRRLRSQVSERTATGVTGIDEMIEGGFPRGSMILLIGGPGTGKTILSAQFLLNGLASGEPGVYASIAEDQKTFLFNMGRIGLDFDRYLRNKSFRFVELTSSREPGVASSINLILEQVEKHKAKRLVIDSLSALSQAIGFPGDTRILLHTILGRITRIQGVTALLISEMPETERGLSMEEYVTDGALVLTSERENSKLKRRIHVLKMRGTLLNTTARRYGIMRGGLFVYPEPVLSLGNMPSTWQRESSGIVGFDRMLRGGFLEGSATMIAGAIGTGKTSITLHFINEGINHGEKSLYVTYEETPEQLVNHGSGFGWNLQSFVDKGILRLLSFDVEQLNFDDHLFELCTMLENFSPTRVVVDSVDPIKRLISEGDYIRFMKSLITVARHMGTTAMLTTSTRPSETGVGSSVPRIIDNVILLSDVEVSGILKRCLVVFKERMTEHSREIMEFEINSSGVKVTTPLKGVEGVLDGNATR